MLQRCDVGVRSPGVSGSSGPARRAVTRRPASPCTALRDGQWVAVDCAGAAGTWSNPLQCYLRPYTPQPPPGDPLWQGRSTGTVYLCTTPFSPSTRPVWLATPPAGVTPEQLARQALASLTIPDPVVNRSPAQVAGAAAGAVPSTWVNLWTWWWTTPATWQPLTATARAGGQWATVTVRPPRVDDRPRRRIGAGDLRRSRPGLDRGRR